MWIRLYVLTMPSVPHDYSGFSPKEPPMNPYTMAALAAAAGPGPVPHPVPARVPMPIVARQPNAQIAQSDRRFGIKIKIAVIAVIAFVALSSAVFYRFVDTVTCSIWVGTGPCIIAETGNPTMKGTMIAATQMFLIVMWTLRVL